MYLKIGGVSAVLSGARISKCKTFVTLYGTPAFTMVATVVK